MLANNWSPPLLCLLAPIKRSITSYKFNNKLGKLPYALPKVVRESPTWELCARRVDCSDAS